MRSVSQLEIYIDENFKNLLAGSRPAWTVQTYFQKEFEDIFSELEKIVLISEAHQNHKSFERFCVHSFEAIHQEAKVLQEEWSADDLNSDAGARIRNFCLAASWTPVYSAQSLQKLVAASEFDFATKFDISRFENFREGYVLYQDWNLIFIIWRTDQEQIAFCWTTNA